MGFAERLATAVVTDDLGHDDLRTVPVDLVASLAAASRLGSDLFRAADNDAAAFRRAILLLTRDTMVRTRIGRSQAQKLSYLAIRETLHWQCRKCDGAGQVIVGDLKVVCPKCEGTGLHRWSDNDRAKIMKIELAKWPMWSKKYSIVLCVASDAYSSVPHQANQRLGY